MWSLVLAGSAGQAAAQAASPAGTNDTRLLFSPTARSLQPGESYIGLYEFLLPFVQVGITNRFSMGAGTPLPLLGDQSSWPVLLTPKYEFYRSARTSAAAGVMHFVGFGEDSGLGLAYGVVTTGTADDALTTGAGWAYAQYEENRFDPSCAGQRTRTAASCPRVRATETAGAPVGMIGGAHRVSRRIKIVTENYAF